METQYFKFEDGKAVPCTENEALLDIETELFVKVTGDSETTVWKIEALQWYSGEGVCRLTVNFFTLETALRIFGEMVEAFAKAVTVRQA